MKIASLEFIPASIPYTHREVSSQVHRDGVTDVIVKVTTDDGHVGFGESCSGADVRSIIEALKAMTPFVLGRSPWESEAIRSELWHRGIWLYRRPTASFAYAGIDMALWDICGKAARLPLYKLFGGRVRESANYFYYLARGSPSDIANQCLDGLAKSFHGFYLKVGLDIEAELKMVESLRETAGPKAKIRLDANGAWKVNEAIRNLARLDVYHLDFIEQPVIQDPPENMREVRFRSPVAICQNEGLWTAEDAYRSTTGRTADIYCFSPYWVGSLASFQKLAYVAHFEGLQVCRHTHGEFGITAAACHHLLLTLPNLVEGNQHTASMMKGEILKTSLPIESAPNWGVPQGSGLGVEVDEDKLGHFHEVFKQQGQFLPYDANQIGTEL